MTEWLNIYHINPTTEIAIPVHIESCEYVGIQKVSFCWNFHNISSYFGNNTFKLFSADILRTIPDGTYSVDTFNKAILSNVIGGFYYKIQVADSGDHYDIVWYPTAADRTAGTNGVVQITQGNLPSLPMANTEIFYGTIWCDWIKIRCALFEIHSSDYVVQQTQAPSELSKRDTVEIIPLSVDPM